MPRPNEREIPDSEYWGFIQKDCKTNEELIPLAENVVRYDGAEYDNHKDDILSFLATSNKVKAWSDYWVTIIQTLGLGYTTSFDGYLHKTALSDYISQGLPVEGFYYYWALRFQFPFAQNKHKEYKELGIVIQPVVSILEHLRILFEKALLLNVDPFTYSFLTYEEIILILMKSKSNSMKIVKQNVDIIIRNRRTNFNYSAIKVTGYDSVEGNFSGRARLYFEKFDLLKFDTNLKRIFISDWNHYYKILSFLAFRKKAFKINEEPSRIEFFEHAFNQLDPNPIKLIEVVNYVTSETGINILDTITNYLTNNGVVFKRGFIEAFLLSIKTKPFVILSGISGVGKSILPKAIMKMVGNNECTSIAVAPDWTDNTDMLGYFNVDGDFIIGEFTSLVMEACENPHIPYFIILDEMNLSRVEYYFAQVLSVIESRYYDEEVNKVQSDYLFNKGIRERLLNKASQSNGNQQMLLEKIANLRMTDNVYIIGTVNVDESTHPFSKKVLDRSNVLEINEVDLMIGVFDEIEESQFEDIYLNDLFSGKITNMKELTENWKINEQYINLPLNETLTLWIRLLEQVNSHLKPLKQNFGFRLRDEVCIYLYYAALSNCSNLDSDWWYRYFDQQLIQKILTRFNGDQGEIEETIVSLFNLCTKGEYDQNDILSMEVNYLNEDIVFPMAAIKLQLMLRDLVVLGRPSTSYWSV